MAGGSTFSPARWRLLTTLLTGLLLLPTLALAVDPTQVATDPTVVTVPDVIFKERSVATAAILAAGLVPNVTETMSGGDPSPKIFGKVVGSTPRVGSKVAKGSTVELYVEATVVTVPDVIFKERSVATAAILAAGLVPNVTETMSGGDPSPKIFGKVVGSTPRVGSKVAKGSTVELYVEATVVTVPDVIFKERSVATAAILAAGLVPNVTETMSGGDPSPKTLRQGRGVHAPRRLEGGQGLDRRALRRGDRRDGPRRHLQGAQRGHRGHPRRRPGAQRDRDDVRRRP